jgi:hypothetical protein
LPSSLKKHIVFTEEEGAEEHCQSGSLLLPIKEYLIGLMKYLTISLNILHQNRRIYYLGHSKERYHSDRLQDIFACNLKLNIKLIQIKINYFSACIKE